MDELTKWTNKHQNTPRTQSMVLWYAFLTFYLFVFIISISTSVYSSPSRTIFPNLCKKNTHKTSNQTYKRLPEKPVGNWSVTKKKQHNNQQFMWLPVIYTPELYHFYDFFRKKIVDEYFG